jgi:hypothetical protein
MIDHTPTDRALAAADALCDCDQRGGYSIHRPECATRRGGMDSPVWRVLAPHCRDWLPGSLAAMAEARERLERIDREADNG